MREGRKRKGKKPNLGEEARRGEEKERDSGCPGGEAIEHMMPPEHYC